MPRRWSVILAAVPCAAPRPRATAYAHQDMLVKNLHLTR